MWRLENFKFDEINYFQCFFLRGKVKIMQQHVLGLEQLRHPTPLPPPAQTGRDSRRFWQDLQITAFLRGLAVHWRAVWLAGALRHRAMTETGELTTTTVRVVIYTLYYTIQ